MEAHIFIPFILIEGVSFFSNFIAHPEELFKSLTESVTWDERMYSRKTASFGLAYNYSQISYPFQDFLPSLVPINQKIESTLGFLPNNCLINYYQDGNSKMGFHSDQTDILVAQTGIAIVSLGAERRLRFRNITNPEEKIDFDLPKGSLLHMTDAMQLKWQHALPKAPNSGGRMSLTFRQLRV